MRGATHAKWAACAVAVALAASACGGGGGGSSSGGSGTVSASWGDPQNPLENTRTNALDRDGVVCYYLLRGARRAAKRSEESKRVLVKMK